MSVSKSKAVSRSRGVSFGRPPLSGSVTEGAVHLLLRSPPLTPERLLLSRPVSPLVRRAWCPLPTVVFPYIPKPAHLEQERRYPTPPVLQGARVTWTFSHLSGWVATALALSVSPLAPASVVLAFLPASVVRVQRRYSIISLLPAGSAVSLARRPQADGQAVVCST